MQINNCDKMRGIGKRLNILDVALIPIQDCLQTSRKVLVLPALIAASFIREIVSLLLSTILLSEFLVNLENNNEIEVPSIEDRCCCVAVIVAGALHRIEDAGMT